jgi:hypothetical protein
MTISSADIHLNSCMQRFNALIGDVWPVAGIDSVLFSARTCVCKVQNTSGGTAFDKTQFQAGYIHLHKSTLTC